MSLGVDDMQEGLPVVYACMDMGSSAVKSTVKKPDSSTAKSPWFGNREAQQHPDTLGCYLTDANLVINKITGQMFLSPDAVERGADFATSFTTTYREECVQLVGLKAIMNLNAKAANELIDRRGYRYIYPLVEEDEHGDIKLTLCGGHKWDLIDLVAVRPRKQRTQIKDFARKKWGFQDCHIQLVATTPCDAGALYHARELRALVRAGFAPEDVKTCPEATAAVRAAIESNLLKEGKKYVLADKGGETTDGTALELVDRKRTVELIMKGYRGQWDLGGDELDRALAKQIRDIWQSVAGENCFNNGTGWTGPPFLDWVFDQLGWEEHDKERYMKGVTQAVKKESSVVALHTDYHGGKVCNGLRANLAILAGQQNGPHQTIAFKRHGRTSGMYTLPKGSEYLLVDEEGKPRSVPGRVLEFLRDRARNSKNAYYGLCDGCINKRVRGCDLRDALTKHFGDTDDLLDGMIRDVGWQGEDVEKILVGGGALAEIILKTYRQSEGINAKALHGRFPMADAASVGGVLLTDYVFNQTPFKLSSKVVKFHDVAAYGWGMEYTDDLLEGQFKVWIRPGEAIPKVFKGTMYLVVGQEYHLNMYGFHGETPEAVKGLAKLTAMAYIIAPGDGLEYGEEVTVTVKCHIDHSLPQPTLSYKRGKKCITEELKFFGMHEDEKTLGRNRKRVLFNARRLAPLPLEEGEDDDDEVIGQTMIRGSICSSSGSRGTPSDVSTTDIVDAFSPTEASGKRKCVGASAWEEEKKRRALDTGYIDELFITHRPDGEPGDCIIDDRSAPIATDYEERVNMEDPDEDLLDECWVEP